MIERSNPEQVRITSEAGHSLGARQESYRRRLEDGYARIDEASLSGNDVSEWESFWIHLLREYEDICQELERAA